ncbi:uncharacterized protein LOC120429939 [Culex pipiens pallens]|uniref:uncharacterized protein LOC120429939 n=1 Tax=Culex pipiens pallens TaxID=42434 RepID=UPI0022AA354B|nr:uncharacterized protein LOC120429939 [Culex pipiens pallens]
MVYVARDGTVHQSQPWGVQRLLGLITGFFNFFVMFFKTLFGDLKPSGSGDTASSGSSRRGGGGGPPGPPGGPRQRPIGRMMTLRDCTIPGGG